MDPCCKSAFQLELFPQGTALGQDWVETFGQNSLSNEVMPSLEKERAHPALNLSSLCLGPLAPSFSPPSESEEAWRINPPFHNSPANSPSNRSGGRFKRCLPAASPCPRSKSRACVAGSGGITPNVSDTRAPRMRRRRGRRRRRRRSYLCFGTG